MGQWNGRFFTRRTFIKAASLSLTSAITLPYITRGVVALQPYNLEIEDISEGSKGKIRLEIRHEGVEITDCDCTSHYVESAEVDVDGQIKQIHLKRGLQFNNPFTVELDLGEIVRPSNVKARARCNIHGWSAWTQMIQIPQYNVLSSTIRVAIPALTGVAVLLFIILNFKKRRATTVKHK